MRILLAAALSIAALAGAQAQQRPSRPEPAATAAPAANLGMPLADLASRFNAYARQKGLGQRLVQTDCGEEVLRTCQYRLGRAGIVAASTADKRTLRDLIMISDGAGALDAVAGILVFMAIFEPTVDPTERAAAFKVLSEPGSDKVASVGRTRFRMSQPSGFGTWIVVDRSAN
jgi:hypothetical protein